LNYDKIMLSISAFRLNEELENEDSSLPKPLPRKKSRQSKAQIKNDLSNEIQEAIRQSKELQEQVKSKLAGPQDSRSLERQNWGQWITSIIPTIDDRIWNRYVVMSSCYIIIIIFIINILIRLWLSFHLITLSVCLFVCLVSIETDLLIQNLFFFFCIL
jgi:hypothetical protein